MTEPLRGPLWRAPGMPSLVAMTALGFSGYAVLLPVAPLWALQGGAGTDGSGLVNGVLLLFTVLTQLMVPAALRRWGWAPVLGSGMVLLGAPSLLHLLSDALGPVLVVSAVRGVGFGVLTVTGSSAAAALVSPERRGEAIGTYGLAVAFPNLVLLPAGPWVAEHVGYGPVFLVGALPLLGVLPAIRLARPLHDAAPELLAESNADEPASGGEPMLVAYRRLLRPTALLLSVTMVGGAALTFTPQMVDDALLAAAGLVVLGLVTTVTRWRAGRLADQHGPQPFLGPLMLASVAGSALVAWSVAGPGTRAVVFLSGMVVLGVAYGALQNLTLVVAFSVVSRHHHNLASSVWNLGFDAGTAIGSVVVGLIASQTSFAVAFLLVGAVAVVALPLVVLGRQPSTG